MDTVGAYLEINPHPSKGELSVLFSGSEQTHPHHHVGPKVLDYFLIHFVISGQGTYQCMGQEYVLRRGDCFCIFPGDLIRYSSDQDHPWCYYWIGFNGFYANQLLHLLGITSYQPVVHTEDVESVLTYFKKITQVFREQVKNSDLQAIAYLRLILAALGQNISPMHMDKKDPSSHIEEQVAHTIRYLTLQYWQPISIRKLAEELGYHRTHFSKMFKKITGCSPLQYLYKVRMERAEQLLKRSLTVEQVASSVGYSDPLYFSKQFKRWSGYCPMDYRARITKGF